MHKAEIRNATSVFLRDTGLARHWKPENLDHWLNLSFSRLTADLIEANADYYSDEELVTTEADGTYALTGLLRTYYRPLAIAKKDDLATDGIPYTERKNRRFQDRTYLIRGGSSPVLTVFPREAVNFGLEYVYRPTEWLLLAEQSVPDFPEAFHSLLAAEGAYSAVTDGGKRQAPAGLSSLADVQRERFQAYLSRFNQTGPIVVQDTDCAY